MKKACLVVAPPYDKGAIFDRSSTTLNRDNCLLFFHLLQDAFRENNVDLNTHDINRPETCDIVLYNEMPSILPAGGDIHKSFLLLFESEIIRADNWNVQSHAFFSRIFTWHDGYVDGKSYLKFNFTHDTSTDFLAFESKLKFCTLIAGNKSVNHPLELYSHRRNAIRWFEKNHPDKFDLYGVGWNLVTFTGPRMIRALNRLPFLKTIRRLMAEKFPSYKGKVANKFSVLRQYKFSICYENAQAIPGYITEKIFDSLSSGCIPVYWGAPNILDYIPEHCFVDKRKFKTYEDLYHYLESMSEAEYNARLESIKAYLNGASHNAFTPSHNARYVAASILSSCA